MSILNVPNYKNNPTIRKKSKRVKIKNITKPETQKFIQDLTETMIAKDGAGLAAPQVEKNLRVCIVTDGNGKITTLINPRIIWKSFHRITVEEGCLSIPGIFGKVKRPTKIWVLARDKEGKKIRLKTGGLLARVIQHEVDHLNGILFIDKLIKNDKK